MTLTRAKLLHAGVWGVLIGLLLFFKQFGKIDTQPGQGILIAVSVILLIGLVLLESGFGVEKPDERANSNFYKANSLLFNMLDFALLLYIAFWDKTPLTIPYEYILVLAGLLHIFQDLAFLYYERRSV